MADLPAAAVAALQRGNKVEAIKILRAETGMGLKEAKEAVENPGIEDPGSGNTVQAGVITGDVLAALERGNKIEAIKRYRNLTGSGLKESKETIEGYINTRPDLKEKFKSPDIARGIPYILLVVIVIIIYMMMK